MASINLTIGGLPTPQQWFRKHVFGGRDYETLSVFYVPERVYEGIPRPRVLSCTMFGTLTPQEELTAPDIETGQMGLDALFKVRFPDHQCGEGCTGAWSSPTGGDSSRTYEEPVSRRVQ
jgi:hypothetical protein